MKSEKIPSSRKTAEIEGSVESMTEFEERIELTIRIKNPLNRTIYYISNARAIIFDASTRHLRVQLSDKGRKMPPGGIIMMPRFRQIDPNSEAMFKLRLPKKIVKLADVQPPTGEVILEEHAITEADKIVLEIGWADTPYYKDPRDRSRETYPVSSWEQQTLYITFTT